MKRGLRIVIWLMALVLLFTAGCALAAGSVLSLPASLVTIEEEAFYGDKSLTEVQLGEQVTRIESLAFANSSLQEIYLPESIDYIAEDAFSGTRLTKVRACEGSYAYDWAEAHDLPVVTISPAPRVTTSNGTVIKVQWDEVDNANRYMIDLAKDSSFIEIIDIEYTSNFEYTFGGLTPNTRYYIRVWAFNTQLNEWYCGANEFKSIATGRITQQIPVTSISRYDQTGDDVWMGTGYVGLQDERVKNAMTIEPVTATNMSLIWTSSNPDVATVDSDTGIVTCVSMGRTTITVSAADGGGAYISGTYEVAPVSPTDVVVDVNGTSATVNWIASPDADYQTIVFESVDDSQTYDIESSVTSFTVDYLAPNTEYEVYVYGVADTDEGKFFGVSSIIVYITTGASTGKTPVREISFKPDYVELQVGETLNAAANMTVLPSHATNKTVRWMSNDTSVAKVNSITGKITAVAPGWVNITAFSQDGSGVSKSLNVYVMPDPPVISKVDSEGTSVYFEWTTNDDALFYNIRYSTLESDLFDLSEASENLHLIYTENRGYYTLTGLDENTTYYINVLECYDNASSESDIISVTTGVESHPVLTDMAFIPNYVELDVSQICTTSDKLFFYPEGAVRPAVSWENSDSSIAFVDYFEEYDDAACIKAISPGVAMITVIALEPVTHEDTDVSSTMEVRVRPYFTDASVNGTTISLEWAEFANAVDYSVLYSTQEYTEEGFIDGSWDFKALSADGPSCELTDLEENTQYYIVIRTYWQDGDVYKSIKSGVIIVETESAVTGPTISGGFTTHEKTVEQGETVYVPVDITCSNGVITGMLFSADFTYEWYVEGNDAEHFTDDILVMHDVVSTTGSHEASVLVYFSDYDGNQFSQWLDTLYLTVEPASGSAENAYGAFVDTTSTVTLGDSTALLYSVGMDEGAIHYVILEETEHDYGIVNYNQHDGNVVSDNGLFVIDTSVSPFNSPGTYVFGLSVISNNGINYDLDSELMLTVREPMSVAPQFTSITCDSAESGVWAYWTDVEGETGYKLYYGTSPYIEDATEVLINVSDMNYTKLNNTIMLAGNTYYLWVKATDGTYDSPASDRGFVVVPEEEKPCILAIEDDDTYWSSKYVASVETFNIICDSSYSVSMSASGSGWLSHEQAGNTLYISTQKNTTGSERNGYIRVTCNEHGESVKISVRQKTGVDLSVPVVTTEINGPSCVVRWSSDPNTDKSRYQTAIGTVDNIKMTQTTSSSGASPYRYSFENYYTGYDFFFRVQFYTDTNDGPWSDWVFISTNAATLVSSISIDSYNKSIHVGDTVTLSATVKPSNASMSNVSWSIVSGNDVATIEQLTGRLTALKSGKVTVRATSTDGRNIYSTRTFTIIEPEDDTEPVSSISITCPDTTLTVGETTAFTADVRPYYATNRMIKWIVRNGTGSAEINSDGMLTALTPGYVYVSAASVDGSGTTSGEVAILISREAPTVTLKTLTSTSLGNAYLRKVWFDAYMKNTTTLTLSMTDAYGNPVAFQTEKNVQDGLSEQYQYEYGFELGATYFEGMNVRFPAGTEPGTYTISVVASNGEEQSAPAEFTVRLYKQCIAHQYSVSYSLVHPHYAHKTCTECGYSFTDTSDTAGTYAGCCDCYGHEYRDGVCIRCGVQMETPQPEVVVKTKDDEYIEYVESLLAGGYRSTALLSWLNYGNNPSNSGYLLLEMTQDMFVEKHIDKDASVWRVNKVLRSIPDLGIDTLNEWIKGWTGTSDAVKQYGEILEKSYLLFAGLSLKKTEDAIAPYADMAKYLSSGKDMTKNLVDVYYDSLGGDWTNYTMKEIEELYDYSVEIKDTTYPELTKLGKQIKAWKTTGTIVDGGFLVFNGTKLVSNIYTMKYNKLAFLASLTSAGNEVIESLVELRRNASDGRHKDLVTAIDNFIEAYYEVISGSIMEYATSTTMAESWSGIAKYSLSVYNFFSKQFIGKSLPTTVWKALDAVKSVGSDGIFSCATAMISAATLITDGWLDTSEIEKSAERIGRVVELKTIMKNQIDDHLRRFEKDPTADNARLVIADLKLYRSYQLLGEDYAYQFYHERIDDEYKKANSRLAYFNNGNGLTEIQYSAKIYAEWDRKLTIVNETLAMSKSEFFYIPD